MSTKVTWKSSNWNTWQCYDVNTGKIYGFILSLGGDYHARALDEDLGYYISQAHAQQAIENHLAEHLS